MASTEAQAQAPLGTIDCGERAQVLLIALGGNAGIAEVAALLDREGFAVTFVASAEVAEPDPSCAPDAVVLWFDGDVTSVAQHLEALSERLALAPLVLASQSVRPWELRGALAAGVAGVVEHDELDASLGPCLRAVCVGQICVPRRHRGQVEPGVLSAREKQVLGLVVVGYMNSQIAERLFLAESTVKSHLSSAFAKLGVRSRHEAAELILDSERGVGGGVLGLARERQPGTEPTATGRA